MMLHECFVSMVSWSLDNSEPKVEPSELLQIGGTPHRTSPEGPHLTNACDRLQQVEGCNQPCDRPVSYDYGPSYQLNAGTDAHYL